MDNRIIYCDTREKKPWKFHRSKKRCLKHGDYSITNGVNHVVIERKTVKDLYLTLSYKRAPKFLDKMRKACENLSYVFIFIDGNLSDVYRGCMYTKIPPRIIINYLVELMGMGVQVVFTGGNKRGAEFAETVLRGLG